MNKKNNIIFVILTVITLAILLAILFLILSMKGEPLVEKQVVTNLKEESGDVVMDESTKDMIKRAKSIPSMLVREIDDTDHVLGNDEAEVGIIVYGDYDDEFTAVFNDTLKKAIKEFDEKIRIVFRHFPQRQHRNSFKMALSSECADAQGEFWEMHEVLLALKKNDDFSHENLIERIKGLGIDSEKFEKCVFDEDYKDKILGQISEASSYTVIGTPTTYINDKIITGATPWEDFVDSAGFERKGLKSVIEGELKK